MLSKFLNKVAMLIQQPEDKCLHRSYEGNLYCQRPASHRGACFINDKPYYGNKN